MQSMPVDLPLPSGNEATGSVPRSESAGMVRGVPAVAQRAQVVTPAAGAQPYTAPRPYSPPYQPVYMRNAPIPNNPQPAVSRPAAAQGQSGLIGPVGYDSN
jgi:hypothetical protein